MKCPDCGTESKPSAKFCSECGTKLSNLCPECGTEFQPGAKFCSECGAKLSASGATEAKTEVKAEPKAVKSAPDLRPSQSPSVEDIRLSKLQNYMTKDLADKIMATKGHIEGERKQVTMLFSDVFGSTSMGERLDPEEMIEIMNHAFELLCEPVYRYEGTVARLMGDGILAFFGAPVSHEDDPERAVRAALEIQEGVKKYAKEVKSQKKIDFSVRVGLNTGMVVVGEVGSDLRMEYTVMGNAVNIAQRMESSARPGGILISENSYRFVKPIFDFKPLGPIQVKGISEPIEVYEVVGLKQVRGEVRGLEGIKSQMVGRDNELSKLKFAFDQLCEGRGQIVSLIGEIGLGKSRLMAEFKKHAIQKDVAWLEGRAYSYTPSISYWLILGVIKSLLNLKTDDSEADVMRKLKGKTEEIAPGNQAEILPYLGSLLSLKLDKEMEDKVKYLDAESLRTQTFYAVKELFTKVSNQKPLILVFEDLHWTDRTSLELIEHLMTATDTAPIMLCAVFRPLRSELCWQFKLKSEMDFPHRYTEIFLTPLSEGDGQKLLDNLLQIQGMPEKVKREILSKSDGNPFFVEEVIRSLIDTGSVVRSEGGWKIAAEIDKITVPDSLQSVIQSRIDQLEEEAKRVLQMASVIGRFFLYKVLDYIAESEADLQDSFSRLQRVELIRERSRIPELEYIFKHALTQEVAYESLLIKRRQDYHRKVGECLEKIYYDNLEGYYELLAHHYSLGEVWEKAYKYNLKAAEKSKRSYANLESIKYHTNAIEISKLHHVSPRDLPTLLANRGEIQMVIGNYDDSENDYKEMLFCAQAIQDKNREGTAYIGIGHALRFKGKIQEAMEHFEKAHELGKASDDKKLQASSLCRLAAIHTNTGSPAQALNYCQSALHLSMEILDKGLMKEILTQTGTVQSVKGDFGEALKSFETALRIAKESGDRVGESGILNNMGLIHFRTGKYDDAIKLVEEYLKVSKEIGNKPAMLGGLSNVGYGYMLKGAYDKCLRCNMEAMEIAHQLSDKRAIAFSSTNVGDSYQALGDIENAIKHHQEALALNRELGFKNQTSEVLVALGIDYMNQEDYPKALDFFEEAHQISEEVGYNESKVKALLGIAEAKMHQGNIEQSFVDCDRALELSAQIESKENMAKGLALKGFATSQIDEVETALSLANELQNPSLAWELHQVMAEIYKKSNRSIDAIIEYTKAKEIIAQIASKIEDESLRRGYLNSPKVKKVFDAIDQLKSHKI